MGDAPCSGYCRARGDFAQCNCGAGWPLDGLTPQLPQSSCLLRSCCEPREGRSVTVGRASFFGSDSGSGAAGMRTPRLALRDCRGDANVMALQFDDRRKQVESLFHTRPRKILRRDKVQFRSKRSLLEGTKGATETVVRVRQPGQSPTQCHSHSAKTRRGWSTPNPNIPDSKQF